MISKEQLQTLQVGDMLCHATSDVVVKIVSIKHPVTCNGDIEATCIKCRPGEYSLTQTSNQWTICTSPAWEISKEVPEEQCVYDRLQQELEANK